VVHPIAQADGHERRRRAAPARARADAPVLQRQLAVLERGRARQEVEPLEDEPDDAVADDGPRVALRVGRSRQPRMFIIVDLPDPLVPTMATNSPCAIVRFTSRIACTTPPPVS
jgi:hypothetical protein